VDFDATGQLLIIYGAFVQYWRRNGIQESTATAVYRLHKLVIRLEGKSCIIFSLRLVFP